MPVATATRNRPRLALPRIQASMLQPSLFVSLLNTLLRISTALATRLAPRLSLLVSAGAGSSA
jgi:hypothetical protein